MSRPAGSPQRDGSVTAKPPTLGVCLACDRPLPSARAGRRYCSDRCRQTGWRRRHQPNAAPPPLPPRRSRREGTIYSCEDCGTRYLSQQWCTDCARPARRLGPGGVCGHCEELLTIDELVTGQIDP